MRENSYPLIYHTKKIHKLTSPLPPNLDDVKKSKFVFAVGVPTKESKYLDTIERTDKEVTFLFVWNQSEVVTVVESAIAYINHHFIDRKSIYCISKEM